MIWVTTTFFTAIQNLDDITSKSEVIEALMILWDVTACSSQIGANVSELPAACSSYTKA